MEDSVRAVGLCESVEEVAQPRLVLKFGLAREWPPDDAQLFEAEFTNQIFAEDVSSLCSA